MNKNPDAGVTPYDISVTGLPGAEVLTESVELRSGQSRTLPLIVRVPVTAGLARTTPMTVRVASPQGDITLPTTFKSGAEIGDRSP